MDMKMDMKMAASMSVLLALILPAAIISAGKIWTGTSSNWATSQRY
jgi:hypothetical protein